MNIEKIKDWSYENWQIIITTLIILIVGTSAYNYNHRYEQKNQECKEFDLIDKFEESEVSRGYIIYYSDGRIEEAYHLPDCIKLNK